MSLMHMPNNIHKHTFNVAATVTSLNQCLCLNSIQCLNSDCDHQQLTILCFSKHQVQAQGLCLAADHILIQRIWMFQAPSPGPQNPVAQLTKPQHHDHVHFTRQLGEERFLTAASLSVTELQKQHSSQNHSWVFNH